MVYYQEKKANLVSWLQKSMVDCVVLVDSTKTNKTHTTKLYTVMMAFTPLYYWEEISPDIEADSETDNPFQYCKPKVPDGDHFHIHNKYNFDVIFERD